MYGAQVMACFISFVMMQKDTDVILRNEGSFMKHVKTINTANLKESAVKGGCGECQASCQSACKTSCTVANQKCEHKGK